MENGVQVKSFHYRFNATRKKVHLKTLATGGNVESITPNPWRMVVVKFVNPAFKAKIFCNGTVITFGKDNETNKIYAGFVIDYLKINGYKAKVRNGQNVSMLGDCKTRVFDSRDLFALARHGNFKIVNDTFLMLKGILPIEGKKFCSLLIYANGTINFFASDFDRLFLSLNKLAQILAPLALSL